MTRDVKRDIFGRPITVRRRLYRALPYTLRCLCGSVRELCRGDVGEAQYCLQQAASHIGWHARAVYRPYNRMKIRNVQRHYCCDYDVLIIHAMFTILCRHVESEGGPEKMREHIAESLATEHDEWGRQVSQAWAEAEATMLRLYEWYNSVDWKDPFPVYEGERDGKKWAEAEAEWWDKTCKQAMKDLVEIHGFMWG